MPDYGIYIIIALILLVCFSAFFSGSEIVYAKVNKIKIEKEANTNKKAKRVLGLVNNYPQLLSTILVGNNLVNIAASSLAAVLCISIWGDTLGPTISAISMTVFILIFGEILPKTIFAKFNYTLSFAFAPIIRLFYLIFKPIVIACTFIVNKLSVLWTPKEEVPTATDEELINMVEEIEEEGYIDEDTEELIKSAIDFTDVDAFEIMKHRVDVFAFNIEDDINELIHDENIFNYSRVPVYEDTIDNIIGILNTKTLLIKLLKKEKIDLRSMLTEPIYVHKTKSISSVLRDFKESHTHIAIVVDEYGGTMGIVTLEDVLEELVGEIWDETDTIEEDYTQKDEDTYIVDGDMNIYDLFELVGYDTDELDTEYATVGGWCTQKLDRFPEVNDSFKFDHYIFTITEVDDVRVLKLKVEVLEVDEENTESDDEIIELTNHEEY